MPRPITIVSLKVERVRKRKPIVYYMLMLHTQCAAPIPLLLVANSPPPLPCLCCREKKVYRTTMVLGVYLLVLNTDLPAYDCQRSTLHRT